MAGITIFSKFEEVRLAVMAILRGEQNNTGTFTLTAGATSTLVKFANCAPGKTIVFSPVTSNAAGAMATTYIPIATTLKGSFTVQHANTGTSDRTFAFEVTGGG